MCFKNAVESMGDPAYLGGVFEHIEKYGALKIVYLGGSITQGFAASDENKRYVNRLTELIKGKFSSARIEYFNAGIGATTSLYGCARVKKHVLAHEPQLVFVDFSVNDDDTDLYSRSNESLLRVLLSAPSVKAVVVLNNTFFNGKPNAAQRHNTIAKHYGLPIVNAAKVFVPLMQKGKYTPLELSSDYLHPTDKGHEMLSEMLFALIEDSYKNYLQAAQRGFKKPALPTSITPCGYCECEMLDNTCCKPELSGFICDDTKGLPFNIPFKNGWLGSRLSDKMTLEYTGKKLLIQWRKTVRRPAPAAIAYTDGDKSCAVTLDAEFEEDWGDKSLVSIISDHERCERHTVTVEITRQAENEPFMLMSFIVCK